MQLHILLYIPIELRGFIYVGATVILFVAGLYIFRKFSVKERMKSSREAIFAFVNIIAVLYAVLLAFLVIAVWENYDKNQDIVSKEASGLGCIYQVITLLPEPVKHDLSEETKAYVDAVINKEWPAMDEGKESPEVNQIIHSIRYTLSSQTKLDDNETMIITGLYKDYNDMFYNRRLRLLASNEELPSVLWIVLIAGTIATFIYTYFFYFEHFRTHLIFTVMMGTVIGLTMFLVYALEKPFQQPWKIPSDDFVIVQRTMSSE